MSYWNDDERNTDSLRSTLAKDDDEYIPISKILKEMYDEEKDLMYCYSRNDDDMDLLPCQYDDYIDSYYETMDESDETVNTDTSEDPEESDEDVVSTQHRDSVYKKFCYS